MSVRKPPLPDLAALHLRHPGLYEPLCQAYADAAAICLSECHTSPVEMGIRCGDTACIRELAWNEPSQKALASWRNQDEATEQGACSIALATVEAELGMVGLSRAETRTGADFYIAMPGQGLEQSRRLEVSGTRSSVARDLQVRLRQKIQQARRGRSNLPALACVVGFRVRAIVMAFEERRGRDAA